MCMYLFRISSVLGTGRVKNQSLPLFLIFQQCVHIFECDFTQLLNNKIYTVSSTFVEICLKMTNLYRLITKNLLFAVTRHWLQANCTGFTEISGPQTIQSWTHWTVTSELLEKYHTLQPKLQSHFADHRGRATTRTCQEGGGKLQAPACVAASGGQTIWEELPQGHVKKVVANFRRLPVWLPVVVTASICCNSVHLQSLHPHLTTKKLAFLKPPTYYRTKERWKLWIIYYFLKIVQQHYVSQVCKSVTFVLHIISMYSVPNIIEIC